MWNPIDNFNINNLVCLFSIKLLKILQIFPPRKSRRFELFIDILHVYESFWSLAVESRRKNIQNLLENVT